MAKPAHLLEDDRLCALERYDVLDTPSEEVFDRITRLVRRVLDVPIATVTFLDAHRQWFKSELGFGAKETPREPAFCNHAIKATEPFVIPDAHADPRFATNPLVVGPPFIRFYAGVPLASPDGHNIGTLCAIDTRPRQLDAEQIQLLVDFARFTVDELELRRLATTDSLTGTMSRRAFRDEAARAVTLALRHQHELCCIALDLDRFKSINDTYGHAFGDRVLRETAQTCFAAMRKSDLFGRIGGEEFAIVLPHTGRKAAVKVAEKLRAAVAAQRFPIGDVEHSVTASFGVAALDRTVPGFDALLHGADAALYAAKAGGRDRVVCWQPAEPERATVRRRVLKAGRISFNDRRSSIDCTVRSLSDSEAGLDVFTSAGIPQRFELVIEADRFTRPCHLVSATEKHIEVRFD